MSGATGQEAALWPDMYQASQSTRSTSRQHEGAEAASHAYHPSVLARAVPVPIHMFTYAPRHGMHTALRKQLGSIRTAACGWPCRAVVVPPPHSLQGPAPRFPLPPPRPAAPPHASPAAPAGSMRHGWPRPLASRCPFLPPIPPSPTCSRLALERVCARNWVLSRSASTATSSSSGPPISTDSAITRSSSSVTCCAGTCHAQPPTPPRRVTQRKEGAFSWQSCWPWKRSGTACLVVHEHALQHGRPHLDHLLTHHPASDKAT